MPENHNGTDNFYKSIGNRLKGIISAVFSLTLWIIILKRDRDHIQ